MKRALRQAGYVLLTLFTVALVYTLFVLVFAAFPGR